MAYEKDDREIGCVWTKTSAKGVEFMSGTVNGEEIVMFRAKETPKGPTWRILKSQPREGAQPTRRYEGHAPAKDDPWA